MPHGTPDWWGTEPTSTIHQMQDVGELAARLGSPDTYDRRGNVMVLESFEDGLSKWYSSLAGTGAAVVLSSTRSRTGAYSTKLVGGSDGPMLAGLLRTVIYPAPSQVGLEFSFELSGLADIVEMDLTHLDGTHGYRPFVRWVRSTSDFEYMDAAGVWQDIDASKPLNVGTGLFHTMKMVYDVNSGEYVRALLDEEEYNLEGIGAQSFVSAASPSILIALYVTSSAGLNHSAYLDDVILTQNEP